MLDHIFDKLSAPDRFWRTTWTRARRQGRGSAGCPDARAQLIVGRSGAARGFPQKLQLDRRRQTSDLKISPLLLCPLSFFAPALFFSFQHFLVIDFPIQSQDFSWLFGASDPSIFVFVVDPTIYIRSVRYLPQVIQSSAVVWSWLLLSSSDLYLCPADPGKHQPTHAYDDHNQWL